MRSNDYILRVGSLSKTYGASRALAEVDFDVARGSVHALAGGNGSGKSTLIKVLAGVVRPDRGGHVATPVRSEPADQITPSVSRQLGLRFVHQDLGLFEDLSVADNLLPVLAPGDSTAGFLGRQSLRQRARSILDRFELDIDASRDLRELRPAEQTLVAIARALSDFEVPSGGVADGVLFLDEPTARLPHGEVSELLERLRGYVGRGHSIVFVSHRLDEVLDVCDAVTVLRDGVKVLDSPSADLARPKLVEAIVGRQVDSANVRRGRADAEHREVLSVSGLLGGPLRGVDLQVGAGEVVGVAGLVGSGRTSLLETIAGLHPHLGGSVRVAGRELSGAGFRTMLANGVAYVPEDRLRLSLFPEMSVSDNIVPNALHRYTQSGVFRPRKASRAAARAHAQYGVKSPGLDAPVSALSGGNQQKVVIARWLSLLPRVLLLDEPSQGVDIGARADIYRFIGAAAESGAAVIVVSSDIEELLGHCTRIVGLHEGAISFSRPTESLARSELINLVYEMNEKVDLR
ncbi:sugar ABC transporter ATP-binding protein [Micromonospora sp. NPDC048830]|uniref:sugar ABC transporter ATP-binding protein n=1 Tax=Micromonospora sp. NPDC048830 TaxID=3364257 RepID=UPI003710A0DF